MRGASPLARAARTGLARCRLTGKAIAPPIPKSPMGIAERRERERERRRQEILEAAWSVAKSGGWPQFSVERVAAVAELGRATIYGYFPSLEALVAAMADEALQQLSERTTKAQS